MRAVGEAVDHRHRRVLRQLDQGLMLVGADHDRIDVAGHHLGCIGNGLAAADLQVRLVERQRLAAELAHGDVEGHARARRGLLEDQHQHGILDAGRPELGWHALARLLHGVTHVEDAPERAGVDAVDVQKMSRRHGGAKPGCGMPAQAAGLGRRFSAFDSRCTASGSRPR